MFENQNVKLEVNVQDETVWLTQKQMAELFGKDRKTIARHIQNIYKDEELEEGLKSIIGNIYQTFASEEVYKSTEEKAANFLYLIVKNHVFADGNKRIAATLFIYFLNYYGILYRNHQQVIDNNTLAALTLLIAESNPKEKDILTDLVMNFLSE